MNITEEAGKTARNFIDAMRTQPAMLLLAAANLMMVTFLYFALTKAGEFRTELIHQSFEAQKQTADILSRCIAPSKP